MVYLILILILGLPVSPLLFHTVDIWHACGFYSTVVIWFGFGFLLLGAAKQRFLNNVPVFLLFLYAGISTATLCYVHLQLNRYNTGTFFPFFNLLTILLLYYLITNYLPKSMVGWIVKGLQGVVLFNAILCVLQFFGISQFTRLLFPISLTSGQPHNQVMGFIGNGTHLSAFIGMMLPVLFINTSRQNILLSVLCLILLTQCGEVRGDPAITGIAIVILYVLILCFKNIKFLFLLIPILGLLTIWINVHPLALSTNGRVHVWKQAWDYIQYHLPLTGNGLGTMNAIAGVKNSPFTMWRHLHQEYIQVILELGIIGLTLVLNIIWSLITTKSLSRTEQCLKMSFMGFLLSCCLLSSSHLWVMTVYATVVYSLFKVVNEDTKWQLLQEKKSVTE